MQLLYNNSKSTPEFIDSPTSAVSTSSSRYSPLPNSLQPTFSIYHNFTNFFSIESHKKRKKNENEKDYEPEKRSNLQQNTFSNIPKNPIHQSIQEENSYTDISSAIISSDYMSATI